MLHTLCHSCQPRRLKKSNKISIPPAKLLGHLAVAPERQCVVPLPCLPPASRAVVVLVTTTETSALLASSSETTALTVLVDRVDDPVDARIPTDSLVLRIDEDDFVVLVRRVLVDPVRVEDAEIGAAAADTLLCS